MNNTVVVLAPHTDDGEFGCGGTIAWLLEQGKRVIYVAFSACCNTITGNRPSNILEIEMNKAMDWYGVATEDRIVLDFPVRHFSEHRQEILDFMISLDREYQPELVFMPSQNDIHQDHHTVACEAMRAFKHTSLLGYEEPWNNYTFNNQTYFILDKRHIDKKIGAVKCYKSQKNRAYANEEYINGLACNHGVQIGSKYAEVFEVVRWVIR